MKTRSALSAWLACALALSTTIGWCETEPLDISAPPKEDAHTVVLLHLDEGAGEIARDAGPLNNHGNIRGGAQWVEGKFGKALVLNGNNQAVDLAGERSQPACYDFGTSTDFTIEFWMNTTAPHKWQFLVTKKAKGDATEAGFMILLHDKRLKAGIADGVNAITATHTATVVDGSWHHVALVAERKGNATLYVDGIAGDPVSMSKILDITNTGRRMRIGDREQEGDFEGMLDEVRISNVARKWKTAK